MKTFLLFASVALSIAFSLNPGVALAQHEGMKGHDSMDGGQANMPARDKPTPEKKKTGGEAKPADVNYNKGSSNSQTTNPEPR